MSDLPLRLAVPLVVPLVGVLAGGCGSGGAGPTADLGSPAPDLVAADLGPRSTLGQAEIDQMKAACAFAAGATPGLTLPRDAPLGPQIPIDTIVVIMLENRSFDHLLSDLPALGQPDVEVATTALTNPDSHGKPVAFHRLTDLCFGDTNHEWDGSHLEYGGGKNDGFVLANEAPPGQASPPAVPADGERAMGFYTAAETPFLHSLATTFAIADHYHCSVLGPTWPNRDYLYAASSFGHWQNDSFNNKNPTLMNRLTEAGVDWHEYYETIPGTGTLGLFDTPHIDTLASFFADASAGQLAPLVLVDPDLAEKGNASNDDFHPPGDVQVGDAFLDKVVSALVASPQWKRMAVFVTFDENGGLYDHVPPPPACAPDALGPIAPATGKFDRLGFRVPLVVISPYARGHYVSHRTYDHTSIVRFVETRFLLPALTARDANADPLLDLFDFSAPRLLAPPALHHTTVDAAKLDWCKANFPAHK